MFKFIYEAEKPVTKQDISVGLGLSLPTVSQNLSELLEEKKIDFMFADTDSLMTLAVNHPLRVIATTADKRYKHAPNAPTLQELGYKDYYMVDWLAIFGPAGMSEEAQKEASEALLTVYTEKRSLNFLERTNWEVFPGNYKELADFQKAEIQRWSEAAQQANLSQ